jgi:chromate reductase, NAD(P)H dehydrogenase (quinone)
MKILCISGSLRKRSSNAAILRALMPLAPAGVEIVLAEPLDLLPHFNPDLEEPEPPLAVKNWRRELGSSAGVYFCSPEYAHGIPGVLKNALDWDVSSGNLYRKPVAIITASPGPAGGEKARAALIQTLAAMSADVIAQASISVPLVSKKLDDKGNPVDPEVLRDLGRSLEIFLSAIRARPATAAAGAVEGSSHG